jgi:hypothetical protein
MDTQPLACDLCGKRTHRTWRCPDLVPPKEVGSGFYQPAGGRPAGGDEDDRVARCAKDVAPVGCRIDFAVRVVDVRS